MEIYRFIELTVYSLIRFVPFLLLMFYLFQDSLRMPKVFSLIGFSAVAVLRCLCGYAPYFNPAILNRPNPGILILAVLCLLFIKEHFGKSIFSMLMLINISGFTIVAAKYLEGIFFPHNALQLHRWSNSLMLFIVEVIVLIPLFLYIKNIFIHSIKHNISSTAWNTLWVIPFTFYTVWYRNSYFTVENPEILALDPLYMFYSLLVGGGSMIIYTMVARLINERVENMRLREKEYLLTLQQTQYHHLQERIEETRTAKHDMRQHLHMLSAYLADKKYDELESYINSLRKAIPENSVISYCDHYAVNALLQYFSGMAAENNIAFSARIELPPQVDIPDDVLAVLLGNLLENAIQACLQEHDPVITVRSKMDGNAVFFKISNTFTGNAIKSPDGLYFSTKHEGIGIGLRSVQSIAKEHRGIMKAGQKDGAFTVSVLLNMK